jgi:hypothetical protein
MGAPRTLILLFESGEVGTVDWFGLLPGPLLHDASTMIDVTWWMYDDDEWCHHAGGTCDFSRLLAMMVDGFAAANDAFLWTWCPRFDLPTLGPQEGSAPHEPAHALTSNCGVDFRTSTTVVPRDENPVLDDDRRNWMIIRESWVSDFCVLVARC